MHSLVKTIKYNGLELTLKEWAKKLNVPYITLYHRFKKGYTIEKLLSKEHADLGRPRLKEEEYL